METGMILHRQRRISPNSFAQTMLHQWFRLKFLVANSSFAAKTLILPRHAHLLSHKARRIGSRSWRGAFSRLIAVDFPIP